MLPVEGSEATVQGCGWDGGRAKRACGGEDGREA